MQNMKVLITGAHGFIGSHLTRKLLEKGCKVGIIKRRTSNLWRIKDLLDKLSLYDVDLKDTKGVINVVADFKPEVIYHLAVYYAVDHKADEVSPMINSNVLGTVNLLEAAKEVGLRLFVNTSSCSVYKPSEKKLKEESELDPLNLYALTKIHVEEACTFYAQKYGLKVVTFRLFPPYGPADHERRLIPFVIRSLLKGEPPKLTSGRQRWDFVYVGDIVDAYIKLLDFLDSFENHEILNIGTGQASSVRKVVSQIKEIMGVNIEPMWEAIPHRKNEVWFMCADISKARAFLGWKPRTLREGLELTIEWYKSVSSEGKDGIKN